MGLTSLATLCSSPVDNTPVLLEPGRLWAWACVTGAPLLGACEHLGPPSPAPGTDSPPAPQPRVLLTHPQGWTWLWSRCWAWAVCPSPP